MLDVSPLQPLADLHFLRSAILVLGPVCWQPAVRLYWGADVLAVSEKLVKPDDQCAIV